MKHNQSKHRETYKGGHYVCCYDVFHCSLGTYQYLTVLYGDEQEVYLLLRAWYFLFLRYNV